MLQETQNAGYEEAFVDVQGARVCYLHAGSGRPMLLIHGLLGSSANWRNNIAALAQHASVYAIDMVNMGKSQRVEGLDAGLRATAHRIIAVMDALHLAEADVVAHSYGGAVALMLAALHPRRVRRLILFAPANPYCHSSDVMARNFSTRWGRSLARMLPYLPARLQRISLGDIYGGPDRIVDSCLQEIVGALRKPGTLRHVLCIIGCWVVEMAGLKSVLRRVKKIPTLLVWGDRDCTVSFCSGNMLKRRLRGSELMVVRGGGHSVFEETPEEVNRMVLEWLDRHPLDTPRSRERARASVPRRARGHAAMRHLSHGT